MASIPEDAPQVLSLVAFMGRENRVRSEARTIRSHSANSTGGTGRVPSLTLILRLEKGRPEYLLWEDEDCFACGGKTSGSCISERSCSVDEEECISQENMQAIDLTNACNFTIPLAFSGTDKNSEVMNTALEIERLSKYAVSKMMSGTFDMGSSTASYLQGSGSNFLSGAAVSLPQNLG